VLFQFERHDRALEAYRKVLELRPDFNYYRTHVKIAAVYADQGKHKLAEAAFREYLSLARGLQRVYLPFDEAQLAAARGDLELAFGKYGESVTQLAKAGHVEAAANALYVLAVNAVLAGRAADALLVVRGHKLGGRECRAIALLEANLGNESAAESAATRFAGAIARTVGGTQPLPELLEDLRMETQIARAMYGGDAPAMLAAAMRTSSASFVRFARGYASLLMKDYSGAERWFGSTLALERSKLGVPGNRGGRLPLLTALCHFYLGKVHEGAARAKQAAAEYKAFLSRFETPPAHLAQVTEARAALKRLGE
jgi:tetratricopeptide (TPR) repeat protein